MKLLLVSFFLVCTACSTMSENFLETNNGGDYIETSDKYGNTVYRRHRILPPPSLATSTSSSSTIPSSNLLEDSLQLISLLQTPPTTTIHSLTSELPPAETEKDSSVAFTASLFGAKDTMNTDIAIEYRKDNLSGDVGLSLVGSDKIYMGFSSMARLQLDTDVSPYLGFGVYLGDSKTCSYTNLGGGYKEEICDKYFLTSLVSEAGLQIKIEKSVQLRLAARYFTNTRQADPLDRVLYGINIGVLF